MSAPSSSLDPLETNAQGAGDGARGVFSETLPETEQAFRHSGWQRNRDRVHQAFQTLGIPAARLEAFERCGTNVWVLQSRSQPDCLRLAGSYCHDRWCRPCAHARATIAAINLGERLRNRVTRLLTVTVQSDPTDSLAELLERLRAGFSRLRRTKAWGSHVVGGASVLELTWNADGGGWHPHLHVVAEGTFWDQREFAHAWEIACPGSRIVDIRAITAPQHAANYVAKYLAKPVPQRVYADHDALCEAIAALSGQRAINCFGTWRGWHILASPKPNPEEWQPLTTLSSLLALASAGDAWAISVIQQLHRTPKSRKNCVMAAQIASESLEEVSDAALAEAGW